MLSLRCVSPYQAVPDRGFAEDGAARVITLQMRDRLACLRTATGTYPAALTGLIGGRATESCGEPNHSLSSFFEYAMQDGTLRAHGHRWIYVPAGRGPHEYGAYTLDVPDERGTSRYSSFWMDESGVLREATGRPAGRHDPPSSIQGYDGPTQ